MSSIIPEAWEKYNCLLSDLLNKQGHRSFLSNGRIKLPQLILCSKLSYDRYKPKEDPQQSCCFKGLNVVLPQNLVYISTDYTPSCVTLKGLLTQDKIQSWYSCV